MFSFIRTRFGIPGGVAVVALVFAMAGGALAAKGVIITKLNQISPSVQKQLKGKAGAPGAKGDTGAAGAKGDTGAKGDAGANGTNGTNGANGESVTVTSVPVGNPLQCEERGGAKFQNATGTAFACNGEPAGDGGWPPALPPEATETGTWAWFNGGSVEGGYSPVSFPVRLGAVIGAANTHIVPSAGPVPPACDNGEGAAAAAENPEADPGHFCVFVGGGGGLQLTGVKRPSAVGGANGAGVSGAILTVEGGVEGDSLAGTWAVTEVE